MDSLGDQGPQVQSTKLNFVNSLMGGSANPAAGVQTYERDTLARTQDLDKGRAWGRAMDWRNELTEESQKPTAIMQGTGRREAGLLGLWRTRLSAPPKARTIQGFGPMVPDCPQAFIMSQKSGLYQSPPMASGL